MRFVKTQLELIHEMVKDLQTKTKDRSHWRKGSIKYRVQEARAIVKASEALVEIVRRAIPEGR